MNTRIAVFILAGTLALGLALPAPAQDQTMPMMGMDQGMMGMGQGMGGGMMGCGMGGMMGQHGNMAAHMEGRIAFIKAELGIADAQKPAWDEFEKVMRAHFGQMQEMRETMMSKMKGMMSGENRKPIPVPEVLATRISMMESHVAEMKNMQAAVAKFYAALDAKQKEKADQLVMGMGCMM
jgi:LTXXQ motif family protein